MNILSKSRIERHAAAPQCARLKPTASLTGRLLLASALGGLVVLGAAPNTAQAQFVCEKFSTAGDGGATAPGGTGNVACGTNAKANGTNGENTAFGFGANATGGTTGSAQLGSLNTAIGSGAVATSNQAGRNTAIGARASATGSGRNISIGLQSATSGDSSDNIAIGFLSKANGSGGNIAIGARANANASGANMFNTAVGDSSTATGRNSSALGFNAKALHANAAAFGTRATTTRDDQQMFGTATNTYTMAGVTSAASATAQGAPTRIVTTNESGDLAAQTASELGLATPQDLTELEEKTSDNMMAIQENSSSIESNSSSIANNSSSIASNSARIGGLETRLDQNERRTDDALEGVAIAVSMANPDLVGTESFAIAMNWGGFEGENALGLTTMGVLSRDFIGTGARLSLGGGLGVGLAKDNVAGRAGGQLSW